MKVLLIMGMIVIFVVIVALGIVASIDSDNDPF